MHIWGVALVSAPFFLILIRGLVTTVNLFYLDYTVLLICLLIVAYKALQACNGHNRDGGRRAMKKAGKDGFFKVMVSRLRARHHASDN